MNFLVKWVYNRRRQQIWDLLVEEFYGSIPDNVKQPALDFLANGKEKLEKAWSIQAYHLQRRSIMDNKNADVYKGMLIIIKAQMLALNSVEKVKYVKEETEKKVDLVSEAEDFIIKGKARFGNA